MLSIAMQVLSKEEFSATLPLPVEEFVDGLTARLAPRLGSYRIPVDSLHKTALAKLLARILPQDSEVVVWINGWSVWRSGEHLDLFYGYRRSHGEERLLIEAPVHVFHGESDKPAFISVISLILYFLWDAKIFDRTGNFLIGTSNDEFIDVYLAESESERFKEAIAHFGLHP